MFLTGEFFLSNITNFNIVKYPRAKFLLSFWTGFGIWQILLFILGLKGLYNYWILLFLITGAFIISMDRLVELIGFCITGSKNINYLGLSIISIPAILFLITKGLYPAGGHDYYNHYFQFY